MPKRLHHPHEGHKIKHTGWLRAAVLGANDGIVSTSCLMLGVAAAASGAHIFVTGMAGLVAGALSMATGEYISVHSQQDTEYAALEEEKAELNDDYHGEVHELTTIYMQRGLDQHLAHQVAVQLMNKNALHAHAQDELGIHQFTKANPVQAALSSATSFSVGALMPLLAALFAPTHYVISAIVITALIALAVLGIVSAKAGGARPFPAACRVTFWSALAMLVTFGVGTLFR